MDGCGLKFAGFSLHGARRSAQRSILGGEAGACHPSVAARGGGVSMAGAGPEVSSRRGGGCEDSRLLRFRGSGSMSVLYGAAGMRRLRDGPLQEEHSCLYAKTLYSNEKWEECAPKIIISHGVCVFFNAMGDNLCVTPVVSMERKKKLSLQMKMERSTAH